jgi:uncharacterized protein (TIGR03435 family)
MNRTMRNRVLAVSLVALTAGIVVLAGKRSMRSPEWDAAPATSAALHAAPPQVAIRQTRHRDIDGNAVGVGDQALGIAMPFDSLIFQAYDVDEYRTVFSVPLPKGKYDYIANLPTNSRPALQQAIQKQFGIISRFESRPKDILLLRIKGGVSLKRTRRQNSDSQGMWFDGGRFHWGAQPGKQLADWLERYFRMPVVDQTGATDLADYNFDLEWTEQDLANRNSNKLKQALDAVGFELVATNQPIDILVVEKAP